MRYLKAETKLFFVVDSLESNEEIFETYGEAFEHYKELVNKGDEEMAMMRVCLVNNAYKDEAGWNYDDRDDTFTTLRHITI